MSDDIRTTLRTLIAEHGAANVLRALADVMMDDVAVRRLLSEAALIEAWKASQPRREGIPSPGGAPGAA